MVDGMIKLVRSPDIKFQERDSGAWSDRLLSVAGGGTGAATAANARTNLGLGTMATQNSSAVSISGGTVAGDGSGLTNLSATALASGTAPSARLGSGTANSTKVLRGDQTWDQVADAQVAAAAAIAWTKISKTGSSLADLTTRSAADLSSGILPLARLSGITNTEIDAAAAIGWSKISKAGSSLADLATRSASDLTSGTLPDARFPATLPALNGSALTALNGSNIGSGTVPTARLGSGAASSSTFLRGDQTWAVVPSYIAEVEHKSITMGTTDTTKDVTVNDIPLVDRAIIPTSAFVTRKLSSGEPIVAIRAEFTSTTNIRFTREDNGDTCYSVTMTFDVVSYNQ